MNKLHDLQGLFAGLRLSEPSVTEFQDDREIAECSYCESQATRSVEFIHNDKRKHVYTCDICHEIEAWNNRTIINITKL